MRKRIDIKNEYIAIEKAINELKEKQIELKLNNMLHEKIEKLIPFISENFITYPLWEEGKYIPFVNFWIKVDTEDEIQEFDFKCKEIFEDTGYIVSYNDTNYSNTILQYSVFPNFNDLENGPYEFVKKDWSIEEMIDLLIIALIK